MYWSTLVLKYLVSLDKESFLNNSVLLSKYQILQPIHPITFCWSLFRAFIFIVMWRVNRTVSTAVVTYAVFPLPVICMSHIRRQWLCGPLDVLWSCTKTTVRFVAAFNNKSQMSQTNPRDALRHGQRYKQLQEAGTHNTSAKTHARTVLVSRDLDLWPLEPKINGFLRHLVNHFYVNFGNHIRSGFWDRADGRGHCHVILRYLSITESRLFQEVWYCNLMLF